MWQGCIKQERFKVEKDGEFIEKVQIILLRNSKSLKNYDNVRDA